MHIRGLQIRNFRALEDIEVKFDSRVNVIVGPNAVGKTTVLEAIRLTKALLSPRTQNEATQALFALGASSPHAPQSLNIQALARDVTQAVTVRVTYEFSEAEIVWIESNFPLIGRTIIQSRKGLAFGSPAAMVSYLSSELGKHELTEVLSEIRGEVELIKKESRQRTVRLKMDINTGLEATEGNVAAALVAALDQQHHPNKTVFSYFPADRSLPQGEQQVQLGGADAQAQLESHNSQPQLKYARLKNTIFNAVVMQEQDGPIEKDFEVIFSGILKGRKLKGFGLNHIGLLSIRVEDVESGAEFDIDAMSSGEKGLILTFLLIQRTLGQDGIILLDEPELHLNPAVCKDLLSFLIDNFAVPKNLQVIVCSHSPEILACALERQECSLYHLESEKVLTKVRVQDHTVISEALRRLGTSESPDLANLVKSGDSLALAMQVECDRVGFKARLAKTLAEKTDQFISGLPSFSQDYQRWYSEALALLQQVLPNRVADFRRYYESPKGRKNLTYENYRIEDFLQGLTVTRGDFKEKVVGQDAAIPHFQQQVAIVRAAEKSFESSLYEIRHIVQADLLDSELETAEQLSKFKFHRAAGAIAGVVLERHLSQICSDRGIKIAKKNPTIGDFNEALKASGFIDLPQWRHIQLLADLRNICDHAKIPDPTEAQVNDLISGTKKIIKTVF